MVICGPDVYPMCTRRSHGLGAADDSTPRREFEPSMMDHDFTEWSPRQELASTLQCRLLLRGRLAPTPYWPSPREILNFGPTEHHANDVGLNAASRRVCSVFELLAFRSAHPAHDTNDALGRPIRVVCCHASHGSTPATSRLEPIRRVSRTAGWSPVAPTGTQAKLRGRSTAALQAPPG